MVADQTMTPDLPGGHTALATELFRKGDLSLARAANVADMTLSEFIVHISRLGIPVINQTDAEVEEDMDTLDEFLRM